MRINLHTVRLFILLIAAGIFSLSDVQSQTGDATRTINFPLPHEVFSLYDFAEVRFETDKTEVSPADLFNKNFQLVTKIFPKDSLHFEDSVQSVWFKFTVGNDYASDTSIALIFPGSVSKAILYKREGEKIVFVGKTGWVIAVNARNIPYEWGRIDLPLKANSQTDCFIQIPRILFLLCPKTPALESIAYADLNAFNREREVNRPNLLWNYLFMGIFLMFFVFGLIKYLVLGKDRSYLYYALLGLSLSLQALCTSEYPPLELGRFENIRGIELLDLLIEATILTQGLFLLEIVNLKSKYPRITRIIKWIYYLRMFVQVISPTFFYLRLHIPSILAAIITVPAIVSGYYLYFFFMLSWVLYLATIRRGFYRFIFLGALAILIAFILVLCVHVFKLYYLLPAWFGDDPRGMENHFMDVAFVIDMCFYFTGLAYRDRQVEKDKIKFQGQLIKQLEENKELQEKFTGELQLQVKEKTTELIEQRKALEAEREAKLLADFNRKFSESELKALRAQMNPHFVFNILNSIQHFITIREKEEALNYLSKFSKLIRKILENSRENTVSISDELQLLELYIQLEQLRFNNKFDYHIAVSEKIDIENTGIPPLLIQPYIENAIVHGLINKSGKGDLWLSLEKNNGLLICKIEDNGIGRAKAQEIEQRKVARHKSLGIKVTNERISTFSALLDYKMEVVIEDLFETKTASEEAPQAAGTRVTISIPVKEEEG